MSAWLKGVEPQGKTSPLPSEGSLGGLATDRKISDKGKGSSKTWSPDPQSPFRGRKWAKRLVSCRTSRWNLWEQSCVTVYIKPQGISWMVACAYSPSVWKVEAGGSLWVHGQPGLQSEFQPSLCYRLRFCCTINYQTDEWPYRELLVEW